MGSIRTPKPVKLISAIMAINNEYMEKTQTELIKIYGNIDLESEIFDFSHTSYYKKEMGDNLIKKFISFENLFNIEIMPDIKLNTNNIELELSDYCDADTQICRKINIDPGYISPAKLVLLTTKNYDHRIYIRNGIYGEVTLHFTKGKFHPWEWTYPDYKTEFAINFFTKVRNKYMNQLKQQNLL